MMAEEAARHAPPVLALEHHPQPELTSETGPENTEQQRAAEALLSLEAAQHIATSAETAPVEEERTLTIADASPEDVPQTTAERERESTDEFVDAQTGSQPDVSATSEQPARVAGETAVSLRRHSTSARQKRALPTSSGRTPINLTPYFGRY